MIDNDYFLRKQVFHLNISATTSQNQEKWHLLSCVKYSTKLFETINVLTCDPKWDNTLHPTGMNNLCIQTFCL